MITDKMVPAWEIECSLCDNVDETRLAEKKEIAWDIFEGQGWTENPLDKKLHICPDCNYYMQADEER